jgi:hypothetical protein
LYNTNRAAKLTFSLWLENICYVWLGIPVSQPDKSKVKQVHYGLADESALFQVQLPAQSILKAFKNFMGSLSSILS